MSSLFCSCHWGELALALGTEAGFKDTPWCRILANGVGWGLWAPAEEMPDSPGDSVFVRWSIILP